MSARDCRYRAEVSRATSEDVLCLTSAFRTRRRRAHDTLARIVFPRKARGGSSPSARKLHQGTSAMCGIALVAYASVVCAQSAQQPVQRQVPGASVKPTAPPTAAAPAAAAIPRSADGRYGLQVLVPSLNVHEGPQTSSPVIATLQEGAQLQAVERRGAAYRIVLPDGRDGWVIYVVGRTSPNFSVDARPGLARTAPGREGAPAHADAARQAAAGEPTARQRSPTGPPASLQHRNVD